MKSVQILHTESSRGMGGQELRVLREAEGMLRRGHSVTLALSPGSELIEHARRAGVRVEIISQRRSRYGRLVLEFLSLIEKHRIQILNTHGSVDSWTASIAGRLSRLKPVIIRTRHKSTPVSKSLLHRVLYKKLPHVIVTTGEAVRAELIRSQGLEESRVVSIPTGVDLDEYHPAPPDATTRTQLELSPEHFVVGTVAFLRHYKGVDQFIEVAKRISQECPSARFLVVGDGPERLNLKRKIRDDGLSNSVVLTGHRADIPQLLAAMDVFVLSSVEGEGLPQGLTQAMAMERPVVATAVGSVTEVVKHGVTGLLAAPRDSQALAKQLNLLIQDKPLREKLARAGRALIVESYGLEHMLNRTEDLYVRILQTAASRNAPRAS